MKLVYCNIAILQVIKRNKIKYIYNILRLFQNKHVLIVFQYLRQESTQFCIYPTLLTLYCQFIFVFPKKPQKPGRGFVDTVHLAQQRIDTIYTAS